MTKTIKNISTFKKEVERYALDNLKGLSGKEYDEKYLVFQTWLKNKIKEDFPMYDGQLEDRFYAPNLKEIGGDVLINRNISEENQKIIYEASKNKVFYIGQKCPRSFYKGKEGTFHFQICAKNQNSQNFIKIESEKLFEDIIDGNLSFSEIMQIKNNDTRSIAMNYFDMDKLVFENLKVVDEGIDEKGLKYSVCEIDVEGKPALVHICICATTNKTHCFWTDKRDCREAKMGSFGLPLDWKFGEEY